MNFALLLALSQVSAQAQFSNDSLVSVTVRNGSRQQVMRPPVTLLTSRMLALQVLLGKHEIYGGAHWLRDRATGQAIDVSPYSEKLFPNGVGSGAALQSVGGIRVGDRAFWLFSWNHGETMGEPAGERFALEVKFHGGKLAVTRAALLQGPGAILRLTDARRVGDRLVLVTGGGISVFDLRDWKEDRYLEGASAMAPSGKVYWGAEGAAYRYDPATGDCALASKPGLGDFIFALSVDDQDILFFDGGLANPTTGATYRYPRRTGTSAAEWIFAVPGVGVVLADRYIYPTETPGVVLSARALKPLALVRRQ